MIHSWGKQTVNVEVDKQMAVTINKRWIFWLSPVKEDIRDTVGHHTHTRNICLSVVFVYFIFCSDIVCINKLTLILKTRAVCTYITTHSSSYQTFCILVIFVSTFIHLEFLHRSLCSQTYSKPPKLRKTNI